MAFAMAFTGRLLAKARKVLRSFEVQRSNFVFLVFRRDPMTHPFQGKGASLPVVSSTRGARVLDKSSYACSAPWNWLNIQSSTWCSLHGFSFPFLTHRSIYRRSRGAVRAARRRDPFKL